MSERKADGERLALRLDEWPATDLAAWNRAIQVGDVLEGAGPASDWRPKTRRQVVKGYGLWLGFLVRRSVLDPDELPGNRLTEDWLRAYIQDLKSRVAPITVVSRLTDLSEAIRVMDPSADRSLLRRVIGRLSPTARPSRKKAGRMVASGRILQRALLHFEAVTVGPAPSDHIRASWRRDALMVALLAARPLRRANITQIEIGWHLQRVGDRFLLTFQAEEMKDGRPLETDVPVALCPLIECYLAEDRPILLGERESDRLWISVRRAPMTEQAVYCRVTETTRRIFGHPLNPHLFRDCAVTSLAVDDPEHMRVAARILGHRSLRTTNKAYNQATMLSAQRKFAAALEDIADGLRWEAK